jgi:hypothetical protein
VNQYREATDAFVHRRIISADLPPDFRSLSHDTALQQVINEFGPPSRKLELVAPAMGHATGVKFTAYGLPGEKVGSIEIKPHLVSALLFLGGANFFHRVREAGSGVNGKLCGLCVDRKAPAEENGKGLHA